MSLRIRSQSSKNRHEDKKLGSQVHDIIDSKSTPLQYPSPKEASPPSYHTLNMQLLSFLLYKSCHNPLLFEADLSLSGLALLFGYDIRALSFYKILVTSYCAVSVSSLHTEINW